MNYVNKQFVQDHLKVYEKDSHKGHNGKLTIIGGSKLFHGASLWALKTAARVVDMVYYVSIPENQVLSEYLKKNLYSFINVPRGKEEEYMTESDTILIGPGMVRGSSLYTGTGENGKETKKTTLKYFKQFPQKQWIVDAGALQSLKPDDLKQLNHPIITPHLREFTQLFDLPQDTDQYSDLDKTAELVQKYAKQLNATIVLKGKVDIICSPDQHIFNKTGNEGMTKGGTGDVLAGLIAALSCTNDPFTAAAIGAYINGEAGDFLYKSVGPYFNADDLCNQIPTTLWQQVNE